MNVKDIAKKYENDMLRDYHHLHEKPELSCQEKETARYIADQLRNIGLEPCMDYPEYGVTALVEGAYPGKTILLRADIDALPITELTGIEHASKTPGVMHACGHDTHASGLLGAARILYDLRGELHGNVKLCFQPAEEVPNHGARLMVEAGALENPKPDFSAGVHVDSSIQIGQVFAPVGPVSAYGDRLTVTLTGKGAHGSQPQYANDPVGAVLVICNMIQEFRGRFAPGEGVLIQITKLQAGTVENIIPGECSFGLCIRAHSLENREKIKSGIMKIVDSMSEFYGMTYTADGFKSDFPVVINSEEGVELAKGSFEKLGLEYVDIKDYNTFGAEDFGYFANASGIPGVFVRSGSSNDNPDTRYPAHNPRFLVDERVIAQNAVILSQIAVDFLNG